MDFFHHKRRRDWSESNWKSSSSPATIVILSHPTSLTHLWIISSSHRTQRNYVIVDVLEPRVRTCRGISLESKYATDTRNKAMYRSEGTKEVIGVFEARDWGLTRSWLERADHVMCAAGELNSTRYFFRGNRSIALKHGHLLPMGFHPRAHPNAACGSSRNLVQKRPIRSSNSSGLSVLLLLLLRNFFVTTFFPRALISSRFRTHSASS